MSYSVTPVGFVRSCFKEKFAIPRQPHLAPAARGVLELVREEGLLDDAMLDDILRPENMIAPRLVPLKA